MKMEVSERKKAQEVLTAALRGGLGGVPLAGSMLSELLGLFHNPLEARKERWLTDLTEALTNVEKQLGVLPSSLEENEEFVSFLYQATHVALKNHQAEKLQALRHGVENSARGASEVDESFQFLRYVDELTVTHISILAALDRHAGQFSRLLKLEQVHEELEHILGRRLDRTRFRAMLNDLENQFLVRVSDCEELPEFRSSRGALLLESSSDRPAEVTSLGHSFIAFVSQKREPDSNEA